MHELICMFAAPIPVGNRFECRWFGEREAKLFGKGELTTLVHQPWLRDLETGIEYTSENMFEHANYKEGGKPVKISATPNPELEFVQELVGVVRRCRLITLVGFPRMRMQTHIEYEVV